MNKLLQFSALSLLAFSLHSCYPEESLNTPVNTHDRQFTELDEYINEHFVDEYNVAIRYRFEDRFIGPDERVTPPKVEVVRPMLDFIEEFWIGPYLEADNGEEFFRKHVPAEIVFLGGVIYNEDGTIKLGTADAGARITFTNVNALNPENDSWVELQLTTVYHEFAHTVHQLYKLPPSFESITPGGYSSAGSWFNVTEEEALQRGFVSPYGTSSPNEDYAEIVAHLLFYPDFYEFYLTDEEDCETEACVSRNEGRDKLREKVSAITEHYKKVTGVDLEEVRENIQEKL